MEELRRLDKVAYIRFASVYRKFQDIDEFAEAVMEIRPRARMKAAAVAPPRGAQGAQAGRCQGNSDGAGATDVHRRRSDLHMARALVLARNGLYTTTPNPRVGCVIVKDDQVVGEGWHRRAGEPHAEILAMAQAGRPGTRRHGLRDARAVQPSWAHAAVRRSAASRPASARVIAAMEDPNPVVNGRGLARLREAGIDVRCGLMQQEAAALNVGFVCRMTRGRPWTQAEGRRESRRHHGAVGRAQQVDHVGGGPRRRAPLARPRLRDPDRHRYREVRQSGDDGPPRRDAAASRCAC